MMLRGAVMVLMAIDHVRVYSGVPAGGPTAGVFFTRWVTHFCAPVFVFLAGTAAFLQLRRLGDRGALARYLVTRGLMLVVLELTVIRTAWTFNVDYSGLILAGVIWMLGWCMVLLAGADLAADMGRRARRVSARCGAGPAARRSHRRAASRRSGCGSSSISVARSVSVRGGPTITVLYTIVPWIGVMALGYACGAIVVMESAERQRICSASASQQRRSSSSSAGDGVRPVQPPMMECRRCFAC